MKTKVILAIFALMVSAPAIFAQGQGRSIEDRVSSMMTELAPLKLDAQQTPKTEKVFTDYYKALQTMMQEARSQQQRPDRDKMVKQTEQRDAGLKEIFTEEQYKKFKDEIEPNLRSRRRS